MEDVVLFYGHLVYFRANWYIYAPSIYFMVIWYLFTHFGMLRQEKSGNTSLRMYKKQCHLKFLLLFMGCEQDF
jgi:hypothetical protein